MIGSFIKTITAVWYKSFFLVFFIPSILFSGDLKITGMWGVFDVDQDNLVEFLTIEEGRRNNTNITLTGLYEINE